MLLIPYRNEHGLIQACQIRFFGNTGNKSFRYVWLSTPEKSQGVSCGFPLHFVSDHLLLTDVTQKVENEQKEMIF